MLLAVDPATPWEAEVGKTGGCWEPNCRQSPRVCEVVIVPSGRQSGESSPVLSRKSVYGRGQESHRPWWLKKERLLPFSRLPWSPSLQVPLGERGDAEGCFGATVPGGAVGRAGRRLRWRRASPELMNQLGARPPRGRNRPLPGAARSVQALGAYPSFPPHPGLARGTIFLKGLSHQCSFEGFFLLKVRRKKKTL